MDGASDEKLLARKMPVPVENGVLSNDADNTRESEVSRFNGDTNSEELSDSDPSSDCATHATNTDSEINLKRKLTSPDVNRRSKRSKRENDFVPPTNPYFNESLFELSGLHHSNSTDENQDDDERRCDINGRVNPQDVQDAEDPPAESTRPKRFTTKRKKVITQNSQNYPQFLGLQPILQFRCHECGMTGFSSFSLLKEHKKTCTREPVVNQKPVSTAKKLFVTRRNVFMCSACCAYYENYNLFLHIYKVHRRLVCLYCSAIFSHTQKFLLHLLNKHNCVPKELNTEKDFFEAHKQPCFLVCCDCEKIFGDGEDEHFFGHACNSTASSKNDSKTKSNNIKVLNKQINSKPKVKSKGFVEHVTADSELLNLPNNVDTEEDIQHSTENVGEPQEPEEIQPNSQPSTTPLVTIRTESTASDTMETNLKNSEANLSSSEDNIIDVPKLNEKLVSDNIKQVVNSKDELNKTIASPEHISEYQNTEAETYKTEQEEEVRKVPKVTLKIRKRSPSPDEPLENIPEYEYSDDDSDKLAMEIDTNPDTCSIDDDANENKENQEPVNAEPFVNVAGADIPVIELELEQPLDKFDIQCLLKKCLRLTIPTCIYCNHARKIAVNGKQLGLHAIAEHRFSAVVNSITAEELIPESFVLRIKESLDELQNVFFTLEPQASEDVPFTRIFECFQCRYSTNAHKELYLHNRKLHAKSILLCIMCKSNFYSYSELTCHLCPGLYDQDNQISFRCSICDSDDLPSAFRLLVHLRKRHNACDVCLELCNNQSRLSNHVWKHKLHHFCYRCGIAYRNKPDITKHLFWKHGTESVLCKKCLQKKWPHVYHFCMPPTTFVCEECNLNFTKAVALKVHKRLHNNESPHTCTFENCSERFISKKLLLKHEFKHREPTETFQKDGKQINGEINDVKNANGYLVSALDENKENDNTSNEPLTDELKTKSKVDVLDLPALNLSESDSSDSEAGEKDSQKLNFNLSFTNGVSNDKVMKCNVNGTNSTMITPFTLESPAPILENIWDDFKNYQAQKERPGSFDLLESREFLENETEMNGIRIEDITPSISISGAIVEEKKQLVDVIMQDHDYSLFSQVYKKDPQKEVVSKFQLESLPEDVEDSQNVNHDYFGLDTQPIKEQISEPPIERPINPKAVEINKEPTNSSSDSDTSCSCGPDCSCSSGSSSSSLDSSDSDSSTSEGRRKQQARREQRKLSKIKKDSETSHIDVVATDANQTATPAVELIIEEADLETSESETDEEFYDKQPQKIANKMLAEKRKELLMLTELSPLVNGSVLESSRPSTPSLPETEVAKLKSKKSKSKKKKRKSKKREHTVDVPSTVYQYPVVSPLSISLPKNSPLSISAPSLMSPPILSTFSGDFSPDMASISDSLRASKRRRVPNKFYGYSSDEEQEKLEKQQHQPPILKWRKEDLPSPLPAQPPLLVPPITLKAIPSEQETISVQPSFHHPHPALFKQKVHDPNESNDSTSEDEQNMPTLNKPLNQPPLYCYCRCPYDEVSEMIGCDADDCLIEWFHFECVGIMVPPKGQWFCPDCRKKRQQRRELLQL